MPTNNAVLPIWEYDPHWRLTRPGILAISGLGARSDGIGKLVIDQHKSRTAPASSCDTKSKVWSKAIIQALVHTWTLGPYVDVTLLLKPLC